MCWLDSSVPSAQNFLLGCQPPTSYCPLAPGFTQLSGQLFPPPPASWAKQCRDHQAHPALQTPLPLNRIALGGLASALLGFDCGRCKEITLPSYEDFLFNPHPLLTLLRKTSLSSPKSPCMNSESLEVRGGPWRMRQG